jgi:hypothetical protein
MLREEFLAVVGTYIVAECCNASGGYDESLVIRLNL